MCTLSTAIPQTTTARGPVRGRFARRLKHLLMVVTLGLWTTPALAHCLDEYLQATILSIEPGRVQATVRLVPGVAVAPGILR